MSCSTNRANSGRDWGGAASCWLFHHMDWLLCPAEAACGWHYIKGRRWHRQAETSPPISMGEESVWCAGSVWLGWHSSGVSLREQTLPPPPSGMPHLKCKRQLIINAPNQLHFVLRSHLTSRQSTAFWPSRGMEIAWISNAALCDMPERVPSFFIPLQPEGNQRLKDELEVTY